MNVSHESMFVVEHSAMSGLYGRNEPDDLAFRWIVTLLSRQKRSKNKRKCERKNLRLILRLK